MHTVKDVVVGGKTVNNINVTKDPSQCRFGKWLYSDDTKESREADAEFNNYCSSIEMPHNMLHEEIVTMEQMYRSGNINSGRSFFETTIQPSTYAVLDELDNIIEWNDKKLAGMDKANDIYNTETVTYLDIVGTLLSELTTKSKEHIMTDEVMLSKASSTRYLLILLNICRYLLHS